jgi:hypothetical protein
VLSRLDGATIGARVLLAVFGGLCDTCVERAFLTTERYWHSNPPFSYTLYFATVPLGVVDRFTFKLTLRVTAFTFGFQFYTRAELDGLNAAAETDPTAERVRHVATIAAGTCHD